MMLGKRGASALGGMAVLSGILVFGQAPDSSSQTPKTATPRKSALQGLPDLVGALKATPGCLGVETAHTSSGKNVIFAWFKDKKAVVDWYNSKVHQKVMTLFTQPPDHEPLEFVTDGTGPIMVVASLSMSEKPTVPGTKMPISQIAIELYQPLPGGAFVNGRFAPASVDVPHLSDDTPKKQSEK